ncbi:MAG: HAD-IA family hydrolase, partial [Streptosporangiaceae bacterium]
PSPAPAPSPAEVADRITDLVIAHVGRAGEPMPGVPEAIALFGRSGLRLAIASSSPARLIDAVCDRLRLDIDVRCSALDEAHGKPAPDVYLTAARRLHLSPARCLAVEDSPAGVVAAKTAGMTCVAVPDPLLVGDPRYRRADLILPSLTQLDEQTLRALCSLASGAP